MLGHLTAQGKPSEHDLRDSESLEQSVQLIDKGLKTLFA